MDVVADLIGLAVGAALYRVMAARKGRSVT
jgi:hypothetical protein